MEECAAQAEKMAIPIFLGKDVGGAPMVADLAKLPHLLIAGRTGTGKSVCLNSIIMSILMTRSPEEVKLIMIDPKMVELSPYKTVPHLMHPVVVDMQKAEAILEWAVEKMEQRYQIFAAVGARKLSEFNAMSEATKRKRLQPRDEEEWAAFPKTMSSVVIIADEMADMIMTSGKDVERHIVRLAQKSRAVGIH
jgi:S-DNA-T family DNA segregation ATPase FtsK/SpoIIIE